MTTKTMTNLRGRKLPNKLPLPVFRESQLPDLDDSANLQRSAPQIETGVEKEEEEEHDLQAAITAARAAVSSGSSQADNKLRYIPTPDASRQIEDQEHRRAYHATYKQPSNLIRFSMTVEEMLGGRSYAMDEEDARFLVLHNAKPEVIKISEDEFELIMDRIETTVKVQLPHLYLDASGTPDFPQVVTMIPSLAQEFKFDLKPVITHWRARRLARGAKPIIPELLSEDLKGESDPYVCFRRREIKPIRKTRRTDQQSLERLRKLRGEMEKARNLLEMTLRREKIRKEGLVQEHAVFNKRCDIREYQRLLGIKDEEAFVAKKKRKADTELGTSSTTIKIPLNKRKRDEQVVERTPMQLALENELAKKREEDVGYEDVTESPYQPFPLPLPYQYYQSLQGTGSLSQIPHFRKRVGRGGRVFIDRIGQTRTYSHKRFRFDPDCDTMMEDVEEIDENDDRFLRHRGNLSEAQLRSFDKALTPLTISNRGNSNEVLSKDTSNPTTVRPSTTSTKRQNTKSHNTPQQAAIAMTNANLSAAMNGPSMSRTKSSSGKSYLQLSSNRTS
ncbi:enhancer of polycomb-like-domain-containing protein [Dichotomocladium elegans]|nr:enhancer of polycomb-like-domain-containing protein [Dichotomocladium elegans]